MVIKNVNSLIQVKIFWKHFNRKHKADGGQNFNKDFKLFNKEATNFENNVF